MFGWFWEGVIDTTRLVSGPWLDFGRFSRSSTIEFEIANAVVELGRRLMWRIDQEEEYKDISRWMHKPRYTVDWEINRLITMFRLISVVIVVFVEFVDLTSTLRYFSTHFWNHPRPKCSTLLYGLFVSMVAKSQSEWYATTGNLVSFAKL